MNSIDSVQQDLLGRLEQFKALAEGGAVRPAAQTSAAPQGIASVFGEALRAVDAQQHQASAAVAAVERGQSDDLLGAMLDSQKASISFSALLQVRNKLSTAFDDIMRMPL